MSSQPATWHAPCLPPAHTEAAGPARRGRTSRPGLLASAGVGLAGVLLAGLVGSASAAGGSQELLAAESFDRPDGVGWGLADSGQRWTSPQGGTGFDLAASGGVMTLPGPRSRRSALMEGRGMNARDVTIRFGFSLDRMPGHGSATILAIARKSVSGSYRALIRVAPMGGLWLSFSKERGGSPAGTVGRTVLVPGWRYAAGQMVSVRFQAIRQDATQLRLKVWPAGTHEPAGWQLVSDDGGDDIGAGGRVGLGASLSARATSAPLRVRFDDLRVSRTQDAPRAPVTKKRKSAGGSPAPAPAPAPAPVAPAPAPAPAPQAPAAVAPQAPAPAPAPAAPPPSSGGVAVPASIDATGSTNVSAALQGFINGVPNGSTIVFRPGTTYRIVAELKVVNRQNLTFEGNGARLDLAGTSDERGFYVRDSAGITIRGFTMVGNNTEAGTPATCCGREGAHAVALYSTTDVLVEDMDISRVWGDCFYVNASTVPGGTWSRRSTFRDSTCTLTGRHGIGIIRAADTTIANNRFDAIGFDVVDLEPGAADAGATGFVFRANVVGTYGLTDEYNSFLLAACGAQGAAIRGVTITGNTVAGNRIGWSGSSGRPMKALHVRVCGDEGPRSDFVVTDNVAGAAVAGPAMHFASVAGVTVTGNVQPLSSGQLASFPGSTNVTYRP